MEAVVITGAISRAKLQSNPSPPTNQHPVFYRPDVLRAWIKDNHWVLAGYSLHLGSIQVDVWMQLEIEEVESRNEEYPMLLAFLELMSALIDSPVPSKLGAGFRVPGFEPYLDFVRDSVLLKFASRAYKRPADKVYEAVFTRFSLLVQQFCRCLCLLASLV